MDFFYNETLKSEFLSTIPDEKTKEVYKSIFKKTYFLELELKKDIIQFNINELSRMFELFCNIRTKTYNKHTLAVYRHKLIQYINFNIPMNVKINYLKAITINEIMDKLQQVGEVENSFLFNKTQFEKYKNKIAVCDNSDIYLAMFLAVFYGIKGSAYSEIYKLKISDINKAEGTIKLYNGRKCNAPLELRMALENAYNVKYRSNNVPLDLYDDELQIFKFYSLKPGAIYEKVAQKSITDFFSRRLKKLLNEDKISAQAIYRSGLIYHMYESALKEDFNLKEDLTYGNKEHELFYKKYLLEFGSNLTWYEFKWRFKDFIINNY